MNDHHDIGAVLIRYATGIDRRDWELFRTVFTPDCVLDYGPIGTWNGIEEVLTFMRQSHDMAGHTLHRITNIAATVDGDGARATSYVDAVIMSPDGTSGVNAVGWYDDELLRTGAGWQIRRRRFTTVRIGATNP
ncbi:nuclear transport factor 2 family protein [Nocardia asteroides]|uniref:nuclear transport factor 2 family protein n=1 Tax=Nocardia asteroides TaxID=1824 RepID=UPI001E5FAE31|nr:nuclear transport factor 2 family protein [Nocardia asteroides]UGT61976.1 nuclear transport factor 2 family protein [Nocardia asteroides]